MYKLLLEDRPDSKQIGYSIVAVLAISGVLALSPTLAVGQSDQVSRRARGAQIYADLCVRCHNARSPAEFSDRDWTTIIMHMRTRTHMSRREARAVEAFLRSSNRDARGNRSAIKTDRRNRASARKSWSLNGDSLAVLSPEAAVPLADFLQLSPPTPESNE